MQSDNELIKLIVAGKTNLFRTLVERYSARGFAIAKPFLKDDMRTQEVLQDAFLIVFKKLHTFTFEAKFSTWFYTILVREAYRYIKKEKLFVYNDLTEKTDFLDTKIDSIEIQNIHTEDQKKIIQEVFILLKPVENMCLKLFYLEELSLVEIEKITALSIPNIKVILHRAKKNFKTILTEKYPHIKQSKDL